MQSQSSAEFCNQLEDVVLRGDGRLPQDLETKYLRDSWARTKAALTKDAFNKLICRESDFVIVAFQCTGVDAEELRQIQHHVREMRDIEPPVEQELEMAEFAAIEESSAGVATLSPVDGSENSRWELSNGMVVILNTKETILFDTEDAGFGVLANLNAVGGLAELYKESPELLIEARLCCMIGMVYMCCITWFDVWWYGSYIGRCGWSDCSPTGRVHASITGDHKGV